MIEQNSLSIDNYILKWADPQIYSYFLIICLSLTYFLILAVFRGYKWFWLMSFLIYIVAFISSVIDFSADVDSFFLLPVLKVCSACFYGGASFPWLIFVILYAIYIYVYMFLAYVCVCMGVCEREREREREITWEYFSVCVCVCVCEREREREREKVETYVSRCVLQREKKNKTERMWVWVWGWEKRER